MKPEASHVRTQTCHAAQKIKPEVSDVRNRSSHRQAEKNQAQNDQSIEFKPATPDKKNDAWSFQDKKLKPAMKRENWIPKFTASKTETRSVKEKHKACNKKQKMKSESAHMRNLSPQRLIRKMKLKSSNVEN